MRRGGATVVGAAACALVLAGAAVARAQPAEPGVDYDVDNREWNGLSDLAALASGMGLEVAARTSIDWDELTGEDVLFLLYPIERLEPSHVAAFIRNGGQVLLADDFGASAEALGRLHLLRDEAVGVAATRFYDDLPFAPVALPHDPTHPLARGVDELVTNHPAVLTGVSGPDVVFEFGADEAVVVAGAFGDGRFVVLSDPSVLINGMLRFDGNIRFAANLLAFLSRADGGTRRLVVLTGDFRLRGVPTAILDDGTLRGGLTRKLGAANRFLDEINDYVLTPAALRAVLIAVSLCAALMAALTLPLRRSGADLDGSWTQARAAAEPAGDQEATVRAFDEERPGQSFLLPAAVLRDSVERQLCGLLGVREPFGGLRPEELFDRVEARRGRAARDALAAVYPGLLGLPPRAQAASALTLAARDLSRRDFERLHDGVERLYRSLGQEKD